MMIPTRIIVTISLALIHVCPLTTLAWSGDVPPGMFGNLPEDYDAEGDERRELATGNENDDYRKRIDPHRNIDAERSNIDARRNTDAQRSNHRNKHLLPNMYQPPEVPVVVHHRPSGNVHRGSNPHYPSIPVPFPFLRGSHYETEAYNEQGITTIPKYRSGVKRGMNNGPPTFGNVRRGPTEIHGKMIDYRQEPYGPKLGETPMQDWGAPRRKPILGDNVNPSKFQPCGGECSKDEFLCVGSCICIPIAFRCDGDVDCSGQQDELECGEDELDRDQACLDTENNIRCPRSGKCINKAWLCDGDDDCGDFSDETHCDGHNCTDHQFECNNGLCIDKSWVCDGDDDCKDASDESNCTKTSACSSDEFLCEDGSCVSIAWKCDSEPDCSDGSDEADCPIETRICSENEFECSYPRCVKLEFKCDGDDDCGDWSDEENCPQLQSTCGSAEFKCNGGRCIPEKWRCDEEIDCENGEDEEGCSELKPRTCDADEFACRNGNCILNTWVCDNVQDCSKGEDEENCEQKCEKTQFNCAAHHTGNDSIYVTSRRMGRPLINCIGLKHVCDGKKDCPKGEDEKNCSKPKTCEKDSKCQQLCVVRPTGEDACSCMPGFTLADDGHSCDDVDECLFELDPVCSQTCNNTVGSFTCSCMRGYVLRPDGRTCKAIGDPATLLFANRVDIRQIGLNNLKYTAILKELHNAIAMDYHFRDGWIYWSDVSMDVIQRSRLNGSEKSDLVKWGLKSPGGVAVDWIHNLLYWTDSGTRRVEVVSLDGRNRAVIASNDLDKPRAIMTHPGEGFVFWTDWGPRPRIERAEMDGTDRRNIITESVFWPNGLTIDYAMSRIYWADAKHHVIESADFDGSDRKKVITKGLPHPFAITLFEDAIYWTDWHTKSIATANKETGMGYKVIHSGLHFPMDIHSYHSQRQPNFTNHCGSNNGGCSHLCLPNHKSYQCVCPLGLQLQDDERNCFSEPEHLLIFARKKDIRLRPLSDDQSIRNVDMVIPLDDVQSAVALTYDPDANQIYWSDVEGHSISRSFINGSGQEVVIGSNIISPTGLAFDWVTLKLYWTDSGSSRIEASNLNGTMRCLLVWDSLGKPRDIALDPIDGIMYWTDWGDHPKIEKAGMDGSIRQSIVTSKLIWPNGLAIDRESEKIYWVDGGTKQIEYSNFDGSGRITMRIPKTKILHPFGLSVYEDKIYWSDWESNSIHSAHKTTGLNSTVLREGITGLMDVRVFHRDYPVVPTMCIVDNGGCSHMCLLAPIPKSFTCGCPIGRRLLDDRKTCTTEPERSLVFAQRVDLRQISLDVPYRVDTILPLPPMKGTRAFDADLQTGDIYWSDALQDVIMKGRTDGGGVELIANYGLDNVDGLAVDSSGRKLYWTDAGRNSIEVSELDGANRKVLVWSDVESPRAITLDYESGLMYWSTWGKGARIEQADMDGGNRKVLVSENLEWPNGLTIDYKDGRLYWNDGKRKLIESTDLQGQNRRLLVKDLPNPYGLVLDGDNLYWTDWKTESIHMVDKNDGNNSQVIVKGQEGPMDIRVVEVKQTTMNACGDNNGGCSHLCLRKPGGFSCACPTGINLQKNMKTCNQTPDSFLLFSSKTKLVRISLDTPENWDVTLEIPEIRNTIALDFHWDKQLIFFSDIQMNMIRAVNMKNYTDLRNIITANLTMPDGIAIDWLADNIYWTDTARKMLEVARLDGTCRKALITRELMEPRAIAVYPNRGYLYWTDWGDDAKIERSMMDGSQRKVIVGTELGFPNGLAIDFDTRRLYWADALRDRVEASDLNGRKRVELVPRATHPFGLCQFRENLYWTDWYKKSVESADKMTGRTRQTIRNNIDVTEVRAVSKSKQDGWSPCQVNNGFCTHLCFFRQKDYICGCPDVPDGRTCYLEPTTRVAVRKVEDDEPVFPHPSAGPKNERDRTHGGSTGPTDNMPKPFFRQLALVTMVIRCALVLLVVVVVLAFIYHWRKKKQDTQAKGKNVLIFSNPNYTERGSSAGTSAGSVDKRFLWRRFRYDRSQERVYSIPDDKVEDVHLVNERPLPLPPKPRKNMEVLAKTEC